MSKRYVKFDPERQSYWLDTLTGDVINYPKDANSIPPPMPKDMPFIPMPEGADETEELETTPAQVAMIKEAMGLVPTHVIDGMLVVESTDTKGRVYYNYIVNGEKSLRASFKDKQVYEIDEEVEDQVAQFVPISERENPEDGPPFEDAISFRAHLYKIVNGEVA